jgi:hypothetical protein
MAEKRKPLQLRWVRITLRTAHIICFGMLLGGHTFGAETDDLLPWLYGAIGTGGALSATFVYQTWKWFVEIRGLAIALKIGLLCVIPFWWQARVPILMVVIVISGYISHMPGRYRYWVPGKGPPD